jgi:hypothetical protein
MPRRVRSAPIAYGVVMPLAYISAVIGASAAARSSARAIVACRPASRASGVAAISVTIAESISRNGTVSSLRFNDLRDGLSLPYRHRRNFVRPGAERALCQEAIVVLRPSRDFQADPGRQIDVLVFMAQLDFCNDKTEVLAREHIDFPSEIATTRKLITPLLDDGPLPTSASKVGTAYSSSSRRSLAGRDFTASVAVLLSLIRTRTEALSPRAR